MLHSDISNTIRTAMTWDINPCEPLEYQRNPLVLVVARIDFEPISAMEESLEAFKAFASQNKLDHQSKEKKFVKINATQEEVEFGDIEQHIFTKEGSSVELILTNHSLTLKTEEHKNHKATYRIFQKYTQYLFDLQDSIQVHRIATRYVNEIDIYNISNDLAQNLSWSDLVHKDLSENHSKLLKTMPDSSYSELEDDVEHGGKLKLRYGYETSEELSLFYIDFDRYLVVEEHANMDPERINVILGGFAKDIYCLFNRVAGDQLKEWMGGTNECQ